MKKHPTFNMIVVLLSVVVAVATARYYIHEHHRIGYATVID